MYLGKEYTEQQINELDYNSINTLLNRYKSVLSSQMTKSLGKSIINLYSNLTCSLLGVGNQQQLSTDLECDPFLNTAMQRFTCDLYYWFGALLLNGIIGNSVKYVAFFKTHSGLGLLISKAHDGSYLVVANDNSSFIGLNYKFPSSKSDCTILNKRHVISVTWSNIKDLSNCWSNGEKLINFNTGNTKGTDHCIIGNIGTPSGYSRLIGCIGEIIGSYRSLTDKETSYIHKYLMKKWGVIDDPI